jgi:crotonobetainyl-CoA:carnitine CoA-transferase CaiB-like acyl-CoA transferase
MGNEHAAIAPYETLSARDGMLMVAAANPRLWSRLCGAIGAPQLVEDPRFRTNTDRVANRRALKDALERALSRFTVDELVERLGRAEVPCGRVRTIAEALADPQVEPREMLIGFDDPEIGAFRVPGNPIKLSEGGARPTRRPPRLGEHTHEILQELGYTPREIADIVAQ